MKNIFCKKVEKSIYTRNREKAKKKSNQSVFTISCYCLLLLPVRAIKNDYFIFLLLPMYQDKERARKKRQFKVDFPRFRLRYFGKLFKPPHSFGSRALLAPARSAPLLVLSFFVSIKARSHGARPPVARKHNAAE